MDPSPEPGVNAAKHARATAVDVQVAVSGRVPHLRIRDNGRGGANFTHGTGLIGLKNRAEALGGHLELRSPQGAGTTLDITLPLGEPGRLARAAPGSRRHTRVGRQEVPKSEAQQRRPRSSRGSSQFRPLCGS